MIKVAASCLPVLVLARPASQGRELFDMSSITADPNNPSAFEASGGTPFSFPMPAYGADNPSPEELADIPMLTPQQEQSVAMNSNAFVQAAIKAFLNKQRLPPEELQCIQDNGGELGSNVAKVVSELGAILQKSLHIDIPVLPNAPEPGAAGGINADIGGFDFNEGSPNSISDKVNEILAQQANQGDAASAGFPSMPSESPEQQFRYPSRPEPTRPPPTKEEQQAAAAMDMFYSAGRRLQALPGFEDQQQVPPAAMVGMESIPVFFELGVAAKNMVSGMHTLTDKCMKPDAKAAFHEAASKMKSLESVSGHFLANGGIVVDELADGVVAYHEKNMTRFGHDFGRVMRKVFLSESEGGRLPEGMPHGPDLANMMTGMMQGFFGPGTAVTLKFDKAPQPVHIDMQNCVHQNIPFFQQVWADAMYMFAREEAGLRRPEGQGSAPGQRQGGPPQHEGSNKFQVGTALAFTLMQVPGAFKKCGLNGDQRDMLVNALQALGSGMDTQVALPHRNVQKSTIADGFAEAVEHWTQQNWFLVGVSMGSLLQNSAISFFSKKYAVDDHGNLRKRLGPEVITTSWYALAVPFACVFVLVAAKHRRWVVGGRPQCERPVWPATGSPSDLEHGERSGSTRMPLVLQVEDCTE